MLHIVELEQIISYATLLVSWELAEFRVWNCSLPPLSILSG